MNLRLEHDTLRFRITLRELDLLLANGSLTAVTPLPGGSFRYAVELVDGDHWEITGDPRGLLLRLPRLDLLGHKASLPSKQGISRTLNANGGMLDVRVEVDVRRAREG